MTTWPWLLVPAVLAGCHRTPSARERALARLPGAVALVAAADGAALGSPIGRRVIDLARPRLPDGFGCVIDAAIASDAVAVAGDREGVAVVIVARTVASCPALSRVGDDLWVATVGAGTIFAGLPGEDRSVTRGDRTPSVLDHERWRRARPYLLDAPIAIAQEHDGQSSVAAAQIDPLAAWLAIYARDAAKLEAVARAFALTAPVPITVTREEDRVLLRADHINADQLVTAAGDALRKLDAPPATPAVFECPPVGGLVLACTGSNVQVRSVSLTLAGFARSTPVVDDGEIIGLRLSEDVGPLRRGDVVLAIDSHRVTDAQDVLSHATGDGATVVMRRAGRDAVIHLSE